ncbi:DUF4189 domain-containing protein [Neisseria bacilliformis]|nr:DUF4189 domain-containing protein [Neisseria bacilliformis]
MRNDYAVSLLAAAALSTLLAGCQGSLAYELLQAAKGNNAPTSAQEVESMMPVVEAMKDLPSKAELATRKMHPRKWGGYAGSPEIKMLWTTDKAFDTPEAASADALKQCRQAGGKNCKTVVLYSNLCFTLAQGRRNGKLFDAIGYGPTHEFAKITATGNCQNQGGQGCHPTVGATPSCAVPCNVITNTSCRYEDPGIIFPEKGMKIKKIPSFFR